MDEQNNSAPGDFEPTIRMERPDDPEPTIRMERPDSTETTRTRKVTTRSDRNEAEEPPFEREEKSSVGIFIEHLTGFFHRKGGAVKIDAAPKPETPGDVSLDRSDAEKFPPLEEAFMRGEEIGAGGQARLYRGFDLHLRRQVGDARRLLRGGRTAHGGLRLARRHHAGVRLRTGNRICPCAFELAYQAIEPKAPNAHCHEATRQCRHQHGHRRLRFLHCLSSPRRCRIRWLELPLN